LKLTNLFGIPEAIVKAVELQKPKDGVWRVSDLCSPVRQCILLRQHWDDVEEDVTDRIWALIGTSAHYIIERNAGEDVFIEERLNEPVSHSIVSGKFDCYDAKRRKLQDFKITSVWGAVFGEKPEWVLSLNSYRWLLKKAGYPVDALEIIAIFRDWQKNKAKKGGGYPTRQAIKIDIPIMPNIEAVIYDKVCALEKAQATGILPLCTPEERWARPTTYAVLKKGHKTAVRVYEDDTDAYDAAARLNLQNKGYHYVNKRDGFDARCGDYCVVNSYCDYWQNKSRETAIDGDDGEIDK
jgi:hypothetical protein